MTFNPDDFSDNPYPDRDFQKDASLLYSVMISLIGIFSLIYAIIKHG